MTKTSISGPFVSAVPAVALYGILSTANITVTMPESGLEKQMVSVFCDVTLSENFGNAMISTAEEFADRDVTATEFAYWAQSMMGGNTSDMLDI